MPMEVHDPLFQIAVRASGLEGEKSQNQNKAKRCKWWNRGFCREREGCSYDHPKEDCPDHMDGKCNKKGCHTFRHRKQCRYENSDEGCHRGTSCEYLHIKKEVNKETEEHEFKEMETQTDLNPVEKEMGTQTVLNTVVTETGTQTPKVKKCFCKTDFKKNEVHMFQDKLICILKRAICSDEEWNEYEEKVSSEMELSEFLEDLGKVIEATSRLKKKNHKGHNSKLENKF